MNIDTKNKKQWGGYRINSGRKKGGKNHKIKRVAMTFRIDHEIAKFLRDNAGGNVSQSAIIETAIMEKFDPKHMRKR